MDQPIRSIFDQSAMPSRNAEGFVFHPDLDDRWHHPVLGEEFMDTLKLAEAGFAWTWRDMEDDVSEEDFVAACDACDCTSWTPPDLSKDGWKLVAIYDTEDGPRAFYVRPIEGDEKASHVEREREDLAKVAKNHKRTAA